MPIPSSGRLLRRDISSAATLRTRNSHPYCKLGGFGPPLLKSWPNWPRAIKRPSKIVNAARRAKTVQFIAFFIGLPSLRQVCHRSCLQLSLKVDRHASTKRSLAKIPDRWDLLRLPLPVPHYILGPRLLAEVSYGHLPHCWQPICPPHRSIGRVPYTPHLGSRPEHRHHLVRTNAIQKDDWELARDPG